MIKLVSTIRGRLDRRGAILRLMCSEPSRWWGVYEMSQQLKASALSMYTSLRRLEEAGFVDAEFRGPGVPARRFYKITERGRNALSDGTF